MSHSFSERKGESTHGWVAKLFYEIFAVGANWADEVGQVEAILVAQGGCDQSQKLGVSYGHESVQQNAESRADLIDYITMALQPSLRPLLIAGKPDAPHTLDVFRMPSFFPCFNH